MHFKNQTNVPSFLSWETNFHSRIEVPSFDSRPRVYAQAWTFWRQFTWCLESVCSAPSWLSLPTSSYTPMQVRTHGGGRSANRVAVLVWTPSVLILRVKAVIFCLQMMWVIFCLQWDVFWHISVFMFENMAQEQEWHTIHPLLSVRHLGLPYALGPREIWNYTTQFTRGLATNQFHHEHHIRKCVHLYVHMLLHNNANFTYSNALLTSL